MEFIIFIYRGIRFVNRKIITAKDKLLTNFLFKMNRVQTYNFTTQGMPYIHVTKDSTFSVGENFKMNNTKQANPIGRESKCSFVAVSGGSLIIGKNVGISSSSIVCHNNIKIDDNVIIGGNCCIYDTDFHSLSSSNRLDQKNDILNARTKPVHIKKNCFIGAHTTILKGVTMGENSVLGAGSVLTKNIPDNEIWAGNPAVLIRKI